MDADLLASDLTLTRDMLLVLGLVGLTMFMFVWDKLRGDMVALLVLVVLGLYGLVPSSQLFDGFSGSAVISVMATMILGAGLDRTGILNRLAGVLLRRSNGNEEHLILLTCAAAGLVSATMQNPSVMALFLPIVSRLSARSGVAMARLLLPVAVCVMMGGTLTMIGNSPQIMLNDLLARANDNLPSGVASLPQLHMFAPLPVGLALLGAALVYFRLFGAKLFGDIADKGTAPARTESYFARTYGIEGEVFELTVTAESDLVGMSIGEAETLADAPLLLALKSGNEARLAPPIDEIIWVGTVLGVLGKREQVTAFAQKHECRAQTRLRNFGELFDPARAGISEAVIPPTSRFIGKTLAELRLRRHHGISVLAINRGEQVHREQHRGLTLRAGDMLVFHSIWRDLDKAAAERDFVVVTDIPKTEQRPHKLWHALIIFGVALALAMSHHISVPLALMTGAVAMLLAGVLNMDEAYAAIHWKTVFLMACLIPLGWAVDSSGLAVYLAQSVTDYLGNGSTLALQVVVALLTVMLGLAIGHVGATAIMVPIAISIAVSAGAGPLPFAIIAALSASDNLLSVSNPVLAMAAGPAGCSGRDLFRAGLPLTFVYLALVLLIVNILY